MSLKGDLEKILQRHSVTELSKELSVILNHQSSIASENGEQILAERLDLASSYLWEMEDFGV